MKKILILAVVLLALSSIASAQTESAGIKPIVYVGGGIALPLSPDMFKDYWKLGYGFGGGVGIEVTPGVEVIGRVFYNTFPLDDEKLLADAEAPEGVGIDGADLRFIEFGLDGKYILMADQPDAKLRPFLAVGLGMANVKVTEVTITGDGEAITPPLGDLSTTEFALNGGAGFDYMFSPKTGFWMDARVTVVLTEGDSMTYLPVRAGLKFVFGN